MVCPKDGATRRTTATSSVKDVFDGEKIKLTGYLKTENVTGWTGIWMRIDGEEGVLEFDNMKSRPVKGTTGWTEYTIELPYDKDKVVGVYFGCLIIGKGKVWLDNFHMTIDGKDIAVAPLLNKKEAVFKADKDTAFMNGSRMDYVASDKGPNTILTNLGMLWGIIKYYHANVNKGDYNMDAELFRVLPKVQAAKTPAEAYAVMEKWVDGFGVPEKCPTCRDFVKTDSTKLAPDYGNLFAAGNLPKTLVNKLVYIRHNRYQGEKHYYIGMKAGEGNPVFRHERSYGDNPYPDAGVRLLCLYRFWNMVQYFFPDRHLIGEDWNKVLPQFILLFCRASNQFEYQSFCLKLLARINDTHCNIWNGGTEIERQKGELITPFDATFIGNDLVVTKYLQPSKELEQQIKIGDVIEKIDGQDVEYLVKRYQPVLPASNFETQLRDITGARGYLLRSSATEAKLLIKRNGKEMEVSVDRVKLTGEIAALGYEKDKKGYKMMDGNIGYIFPGALQEHDIDSIKTLFRDTKGIVIDMRCYPSTFMPFTYGAWLKPEASTFVKFTFGSLDMPGSFVYGEQAENGEHNDSAYKGNVVIIVNATTQSQAEYTTMALRTAPNATVIGSTTAGADGDVSSIVLPGGMSTMFSGIGILYPDGTETQRKGVKIDKVVVPTIKGIKEKRDELLEEAVRIIKE
jgi:C-terminal processing protease CtpA/Prc